MDPGLDGGGAALIRSGISARLLLWLAPLAFLGLFFFYPLARILGLGLAPVASGMVPVEAGTIVLRSLGFTFYQAGLSTVLTLIVGLPAAYLFARYDFPFKATLRALTAVPFLLPTVVVAAGFNALLGPRGWVNLGLMQLLGVDIPPVQLLGSLWAILLAHVFYNTTIVLRVVGNAWAKLDPRLAQAARTLGASPRQVFWQVTFPLLRPAVLAAGMLVFLFDFTSFGVILLLGGPGFSTLEVEIFVQALRLFNLPLAALLSLIQLACTLAFSVVYSRLSARAAVTSVPRAIPLKRAGNWRQKVFVGGMVLLLVGLFVLPMLALPVRSVARLEPARGSRTAVDAGLTLEYYNELFINRRGSIFYVPPGQAVLNSLGYASITVALSLLLGYPAATALARRGRLERWLDPLIMLPLGASAVTLGLGYIVSFNREPLNLLRSPWLVPLAHTMVALPFVIRSLQPALAAIPQRYREAASVLGASPLRAWMAVDWPIISRASLAAATFAFTVSLGEFGATALLTRPEYPTIPIAIYRFISQPGGLNYGQAMAMATILMAVTTAGIYALERLRLPGTGDL